MNNPMRSLLLWLSGANREVLDRCPTEATKFVSVGGAVLTTAVLAAAAATTTLGAFLGLPWQLAVVVGLAWGVAILNLDRWLVASTRRQDTWTKNIAIAFPRLLLAFVIGLVIAEPLVLGVFGSEVNARAVELRHDQQASQRAKLEEQYARVTDLQKQKRDLEKELSGLAAGSLVARNPRYQALTKEVTGLRTAFEKAEADVICEIDGTCGSKKIGHGPAWKEKQDKLSRARAALAAKEAELTKLRAELSKAESGSLARTREEQEIELAAVVKDLAEEQEAYDTAVTSSTKALDVNDIGLLDRIDALSRLAEERPPLNAAHWVLRLFILALDSLPVLVKLFMSLGKPSLYDRKLEDFEKHQLHVDALVYENEIEAATINTRMVVDEAAARRKLEVEGAEELAREVVDAQKDLARQYIAQWKQRAAEEIRDQLIDLSQPQPSQAHPTQRIVTPVSVPAQP